jgi:hypothetical protein
MSSPSVSAMHFFVFPQLSCFGFVQLDFTCSQNQTKKSVFSVYMCCLRCQRHRLITNHTCHVGDWCTCIGMTTCGLETRGSFDHKRFAGFFYKKGKCGPSQSLAHASAPVLYSRPQLKRNVNGRLRARCAHAHAVLVCSPVRERANHTSRSAARRKRNGTPTHPQVI